MSFDGPAFIEHVAKRLMHEFEFSSGAGTPGLIGAAKEHPARVQLERLMSEGVAVGSGIIVDSYGAVSKQQDIVIYEKICPIFTHNGAPEATYFPVEGVIAAGEVKSKVGKKEIEDSFQKIASVKKLRRHAVATNDGLLSYAAVAYRNYTNTSLFSATKEDEFNQETKSLHQIYTFVLCQKFSTSADAVLHNCAEQCRLIGSSLAPNIIVSLEDGFIVPHNSRTNSITRSVMEADGLMYCNQPSRSFARLLWFIRLYVNAGKTVDRAHYERYFEPIGKEPPPLTTDARVSL